MFSMESTPHNVLQTIHVVLLFIITKTTRPFKNKNGLGKGSDMEKLPLKLEPDYSATGGKAMLNISLSFCQWI